MNKYLQRHTHNGNTSLQNKLHTDGRVYAQTTLKFIRSLLCRGREKKKAKKQKPPDTSKVGFLQCKTNTLKGTWADTFMDYCKPLPGCPGFGKRGSALACSVGWGDTGCSCVMWGEGLVGSLVSLSPTSLTGDRMKTAPWGLHS